MNSLGMGLTLLLLVMFCPLWVRINERVLAVLLLVGLVLTYYGIWRVA